MLLLTRIIYKRDAHQVIKCSQVVRSPCGPDAWVPSMEPIDGTAAKYYGAIDRDLGGVLVLPLLGAQYDTVQYNSTRVAVLGLQYWGCSTRVTELGLQY